MSSSPFAVLAYPPQAADGTLPAAQLVGQFFSQASAVNYIHSRLSAGDGREFRIYAGHGPIWHKTCRPMPDARSI